MERPDQPGLWWPKLDLEKPGRRSSDGAQRECTAGGGSCAEANSIIAADQGRWLHELTIAGIAGANDYIRCLAYLQTLSVVEQVRVVMASAGRVRFSLELNAVPDYLIEALSSSTMLEYIDSEDAYLLRQ